MVKLLTEINHRNKKTYISDQDKFTFISDYKDIIRDRSHILMLTPEQKIKYNNRIKDLLRDHGLDNSYYWIFMMINDITSLEQLLDKEKIYLPDQDFISELLIKFKSNQARKNSKPIKLSSIK